MHRHLVAAAGHAEVSFDQADLYALELGAQAGLNVRGAALMRTIFQETIDKGMGDAYFPVIAKLIDPSGFPD